MVLEKVRLPAAAGSPWVWRPAEPTGNVKRKRSDVDNKWLVVWNMFTFPYFFHMLGIIIPTDQVTHIFEMG